MIYITYENLCCDIRENMSKIPRDVCGVIGVPRSGMLPATMIAEHLNVGLSSVDAVISSGSVQDALKSHGGRALRNTDSNTLLIVDDTCFHGNSLINVRQKLTHPAFCNYELIFLVVYLEGPCNKSAPDIWLRDIREEAKDGPFGWAIYEWNLFAHGRLTERTLFDLDGVICVEPPDERDTEAYEAYIQNPIPMNIPTAKTVHICTYRLEKYRDYTLSGLAKLGIHNCDCRMASDRDVAPWRLKAHAFREDNWLLFVESSEWQAKQIHSKTGKPVICIETNKVYCNAI